MTEKVPFEPDEYPWAFPRIDACDATVESQYSQLRKVVEEVAECYEALGDYMARTDVFESLHEFDIDLFNAACESIDHYCYELMNVIHACETALRGVNGIRNVGEVRLSVIRDNQERGYYG